MHNSDVSRVILGFLAMILNALRTLVTILVVAVTVMSVLFILPAKDDLCLATISGIGFGIMVPLLCGLITLIVIMDQGIGELRTENSLLKLRSTLIKMNIPRMSQFSCGALAILIYTIVAAILGGASYLLSSQMQADSKTVLFIVRSIVCIPAAWWIIEILHAATLWVWLRDKAFQIQATA